MLDQVLILFMRLAVQYELEGLAFARKQNDNLGSLLPIVGAICSKLPSLNTGTPLTPRQLHTYIGL